MEKKKKKKRTVFHQAEFLNKLNPEGKTKIGGVYLLEP